MEKLLTISVAAYNIEAYIEKLVNSIAESKYLDNIEVLLIDDGSKDKTKELAEEYAHLYSKSFKVISKPNGGHGSTINTGIENATGKFFKALDGDDWVNTEALNHLMDRLSGIDDEIIICDYLKCYSDGRETNIVFKNIKELISTAFDEIIENIDWLPYHSIIYKTDLLKSRHIHLDEHCFYVDAEYDIFPLPFVKTAYYFNEPIYCYRLGLTDQSISPQSRMKNVENAHTVATRLLEMYEKSDNLSKSLEQYIKRAVAEQCLWYIDSLMLFKAKKEHLKKIADFDNNVKCYSTRVYNHMMDLGKESRTINILRKTSYRMYWVLNILKRAKRRVLQ